MLLKNNDDRIITLPKITTNNSWISSHIYVVSTVPCCWLVTKSCPTLCDPMDCSLLGSSVHRISQARILEQVAISYSRGYSRARDYLLHCRQIFLMLRVPLPFPFVVVYFPKIQTRFILFFSVGCVVIVEEPRSFVWLNSSQFGSVGGMPVMLFNKLSFLPNFL